MGTRKKLKNYNNLDEVRAWCKNRMLLGSIDDPKIAAIAQLVLDAYLGGPYSNQYILPKDALARCAEKIRGGK